METAVSMKESSAPTSVNEDVLSAYIFFRPGVHVQVASTIVSSSHTLSTSSGLEILNTLVSENTDHASAIKKRGNLCNTTLH